MKRIELHTLLAGLTMLMVSSASAALIIHGPTDYNAAKGSLTPVDTIASSELTGGDQLVITYTVNHVTGLNVNNSFVGLTINDYTTPSQIWQVNGGQAGFVVRTGRSAAQGSHAVFTNVGGTTYRTAQGLSSGQAHAVRITLSGFSDGQGFQGTRSVLFEIDEHSSTFNTADISVTRSMDFGNSTTNEMKLRLHAHDTGLNVDGLTVVDPGIGGYDAWAIGYGLTNGPSGDDDADGILNLYEYGMGGNPTNGSIDGNIPSFGNDGGGLHYVYARRTDDTDLVYYLETTESLSPPIWTNMGYTAVATNITGDTFDFVTNSIETVTDAKFIRLIIE